MTDVPRPFDVTTETAAGVADVIAAFGEKTYWLARLAPTAATR